jgi:sugar/nucleoside kinase (ribokinase family)
MDRVLGMGNALVDVMTRLKDDNILREFSLPKGSMQLVSKEFSNRLLASTLGLDRIQSSGGSAANTIHGLANLGIETGFVGKIGQDEIGEFFESDLEQNKIIPILFHDLEETGRSIALISPDSERTFATFLGAAVDLHEEDIDSDLYEGYNYFYIEGYLVQNRVLFEKSLRLAKSNNLTIALDLASYNVVADNKKFLSEIIREYVDIILANESEAESLTGKTVDKAMPELSDMADIAVIKLGSNGSLIKSGNEEHEIGIINVRAVDTTGAGDLYAAGFLYGLCRDLDLPKCGELGALLGGTVTENIGAKLSSEQWEQVKEKVNRICAR